MTREWGHYLLETTIEYGHAARGNRGRNTGMKIHRLAVERIVGIKDGYKCQPNEAGYVFQTRGIKVAFDTRPCCGCTQGQHAGHPDARLTAADVTCEYCKKIEARVAARAANEAQTKGA